MAYQNAVQVRGVRPTVANIGRLRRAVREETDLITTDMAARLFHITTGIVPYQDGDLYRSAFNIDTTVNRNFPTRSVGYDSTIDYAFAVHELPNRVHPTRGPRKEPKQDHFLSEPRDALAEIFPRIVRDRIAARIQRMRSITAGEQADVIEGLS